MTQALQRLDTVTSEVVATLSEVADPLGELPEIISMIEDGRAQLYQVYNGSYLVITKARNDLLVLAYAGVDVREATLICIEIAQQAQLDSVVFYTARKGLAKLLKEFRPELVQTVYRIPCA